MCHTKSVSNISEEPNSASDSVETAYLDTLKGQKPTQNSWTCHIEVNGKATLFKIDMGAEVSAVTEQTFNSISPSIHLRKPSKVLHGPNRLPLDTLGSATVSLVHNDKSTTQDVFVIPQLTHNLLGLPAITALDLVTRVDAIQSKTSIIQGKFPSLFNGLGLMSHEYEIRLKPNAKPHALFTARHVPIPLREKVQAELQRMQSLGVITKVDHPTPWCAGMVVVPKKSGEVHICVDLKPLNSNVLREVHPLPAVDETLAQLTGAAVFSKLDANSGFWQIPLAAISRHLTTFITPFGRYYFNKLPFGITSVPEYFQKKMSEILEGLQGVLCLIDDILIFGKDKEQHDERLFAVLERIQKAGVTLNAEKCEFWCDKLKFLGHIISKNGISPNPDKTKAIRKMEAPTNVTELRRFMGIVNQLGKFSPRIAEISSPLRELLSTKNNWLWDSRQEEAFTLIKTELTNPTILTLYNPKAEIKISADASSHGLGAVLLQLEESWRPVAYASRSLNQAECHYAQIEKEALAITWACERFSTYILGKHISIETDHKPLVPLLSYKLIDNLPPRVLRFRLRMMKLNYTIQHVPGKFLYIADALSRAPTQETPTVDEVATKNEVEIFIDAITQQLSASSNKLQVYQKAQHEDAICNQVIGYCKSTWPQKHSVKAELKPYWQNCDKFSLCNNLLLFGSRIVVPKQLQRQTLEKIHHGHQGINRCNLRIKSSVWWPSISHEMEAFIKQCPHCKQFAIPPREPMISSPLPSYPWEKVGADLFELDKTSYLIVVDYFSRFPEVIRLTSTTSKSVITALKSIFSRYGVPATLLSDNGPQFCSAEMKEFSKSYCFDHVTSSPHYAQSNGMVERTVRTVKQLLKGSSDPYLALLSYLATPLLWCLRSPGELLMGRKVKTDLPQTMKQFIPDWHFLNDFREKDEVYKLKQKQNYDRRHRTRNVDVLPSDTSVWVRTENVQQPGTVVSAADTPRSYVVSTTSGQVRRNRYHLNLRHDTPTIYTDDTQERSPVMTRSRTGVELRPPDRLTL